MHSQHLTVGTYNIRYDSPGDSGNLWVDRGPVVANLIRFYDFDILGTQEGLKNQLDDIENSLEYYARYGSGRDDGKDKGEHSAIFYKKEKFTLLDSGDFWLSETPDKPSLGWDATCCNRICSWVYLEIKSSHKKFYFFNAHFDHQGVIARKESSKLVIRKINEIAGGAPVIFAGDLNGSRETEWYHTIASSQTLTDTYSSTNHPYANNGSFNGFGRNLGTKDIIDHIFSTQHFETHRWGVLTDTYDGKFPSDHFPILAEVSLK